MSIHIYYQFIVETEYFLESQIDSYNATKYNLKGKILIKTILAVIFETIPDPLEQTILANSCLERLLDYREIYSCNRAYCSNNLHNEQGFKRVSENTAYFDLLTELFFNLCE